MYSHSPPYIHRDQQPDLEGPARRSAFTIDNVINKSIGRSGEKNICSRFNTGRIYGLCGLGPSSTIGGPSSTIYGSSSINDRSAHGLGDASNNDNGFVIGSSLTTGHRSNGHGYSSNKDYGFVGVIDGSIGDTVNDNGVNGSKRIAVNIDYGYINMLQEDDRVPPIDSDDEGRSRGKQPSLIWDDKAGYGNNDGNAEEVVNQKADQAEEPQSVKLARRLAAKAGELYTTIAAEIESANAMLGTMKEPNSMIPVTSTTRLHLVLTNHVNVLLNGILSREGAIIELQESFSTRQTEFERVQEELYNAQMDYENVSDQLRDTKAEIVRLKQKSVGLDASIKDELENLGFSDVQELIDSYVQLQDRVEVIEKNFSSKSVCSGFLRAPSRVSVATERCTVVQPIEQKVKQSSGGLMPLNDNKSCGSSTRVQLPMPDKFKGKTRAELERFFSLYEAGTNSKGWNDNERAIYLGSFLPKMQLYHDNLSKRNASYQEMKQELLNALGSDGAVATYYLRSQLDRLTKPSSKSYKQLFEEVELQVIEAFGGDTVSREDELKKILLRITDEDSDATFSTIVMTNVASSYYKLKELVLALEASKLLKKKNVKLEAQRKDSPHKAYSDIKDSDRSRRGNHPDFQGENCRTGRQEDYQDFQDEDFRSVCDEDQDTLHDEKGNQQCLNSERYSQGHIRCYNCQKFGHFARDCPDQGKAHNVNLQSTKLLVPSVNPVLNIVAKDELLFGKPALLDVLLDGIKVNVLIDSGATTSVIDATVVGTILNLKEKLGCNIIEVPREIYADKRLLGADGQPLKVVNCVQIPVAWGDIPNKHAKFFVVQGLQQNALIGTNILQEDLRWIEAIGVALGKQCNDVKLVGTLGTVQQVVQKSSKGDYGRKKHEQASRQSKVEKVSVKKKKFELRDKKDSQQTHFSRGHTVKESKNSIEAKADKSREGDTVLIGGTNAFKFARLIGAKHWSSKTLNDKTLHSKVAAENVKRLIYFPSGNLFFRHVMEYDAACDIFLESLKQLSKLGAVEVIVLPVFRHRKCVKESEMFYSWYNKLAKSDARLIAHHEQLLNWMEAKPWDSSHQYINANGIVTEDGIKRLCEYLIQDGFKCELRDSVKRNQAVSLHQSQSNTVRGTTHSNRGCRSNRSSIRKTWFNSNFSMIQSTVKYSRTSIQNVMKEYRNHQPHDPKKNQTYINKWGHLFEGGGAS